jgi:coenzyme F420-reducing hydrogenase gamma subunit
MRDAVRVDVEVVLPGCPQQQSLLENTVKVRTPNSVTRVDFHLAIWSCLTVHVLYWT